jgi:peptidoglycan hydrolase-like protein with peptidoglycan-binding domain
MIMKLVNRLPVLVVGVALGCGEAGHGDEAARQTDDGAALQALDHDLGLGDRGAAVRAVHAYLASYGYFPNDRLAREYPAWRPSADAPRDPSVYDENTVVAISSLQRNLGLPESGIVDEHTRAMLLEERCATPEIQHFDPSNKWELDTFAWGKNNLTWRIAALAGGIDEQQARTAVQQALTQWDDYTNFTFTELTSGTADIMIRIQWPDGWPNALAGTYPPPDGDLYVNHTKVWSTLSPTPTGAYDLNSVILHELGHSIGIVHSSYDPALPSSQRVVMYPTIGTATQRRILKPDDRVAAHARNIKWTEFDNTSVDIDVGDGPMFHHTYVTAGAFVDGGREVWAFQNGQWFLYPGQGALRIAGKGASNVWIVNEDGEIYQRVSGSWVLRPGCATDIAVGSDGSVWKVSCELQAGGFTVNKWNGSSWGINATGGLGARRISIGAYSPGGTIVPWIVQDDGDVYRRTLNSASSGSWGSPLSNGVSDIAASAAGYTWALGENAIIGGFRVYVWNEQAFLALGDPQPSQRAHWVQVPGAGRNIATDSGGNPYIVDSLERAFW